MLLVLIAMVDIFAFKREELHSIVDTVGYIFGMKDRKLGLGNLGDELDV